MKTCVVAVIAVWALTSCSRGPDYDMIARNMNLPDDARPICGLADVLGTEIEDIEGKGACGVKDAVKLYSVGGAKMSQPARLNCRTVRAIYDWAETGLQPAAREKRTYVTELRVAASYACRSRNHKPGARLSEHAKGNAIDFSGMTFANGDTVTVLDDYAKGKYSDVLKQARKAACGPFGTVLGPGSDRYHNDHFHFDVADYRSGPYCR